MTFSSFSVGNRYKVSPLSIAIMLAVIAFLGANCAALADAINWKDVNAGLAEAKRAHRYVLADVYTDWCGWCKRLDRDTFSSSEMIQYLNDKFVCVKANAEDHGPGQKLAGDYRVTGYPCALVFDQSGNFIGKISGYRDPSAYKEALNHLIAKPPANPYAE